MQAHVGFEEYEKMNQSLTLRLLVEPTDLHTSTHVHSFFLSRYSDKPALGPAYGRDEGNQPVSNVSEGKYDA
jgi:hypothetical protein